MTINKDKTILDLLEHIRAEKIKFQINDYWDSDMFAIGIANVNNPKKLVYVSTFEKKENEYDYECEVPDELDEVGFQTTKEGTNVTLKELLQVISVHIL